MKKNKKLLAAIDGLTLSVENLNEFLHLGEVAVQQNKLRSPDYFFAELSEKMQVLKSKMDTMLNSI